MARPAKVIYYKGWSIHAASAGYLLASKRNEKSIVSMTLEGIKNLIDSKVSKNPAILKPKLGKWIPVHAVKFLRGKTLLMK